VCYYLFLDACACVRARPSISVLFVNACARLYARPLSLLVRVCKCVCVCMC